MDSEKSADWKKNSIRSRLLAMGWKEWGILLLLGIILLVDGLPETMKTVKATPVQRAAKTRLQSRLEGVVSRVEGGVT